MQNDDTVQKIKELEEEIARLKSTIPREVVFEKQQNTETPLFSDCDILFYLKSILGYSITYQKNTIILRSVYSFSCEDVFELEIRENRLCLKPTDYLNEWQEYTEIYIKKGRSYCAFFAAVTLELYNRKTFG